MSEIVADAFAPSYRVTPEVADDGTREAGPTVYAVQRTRSVYLGMVVHCTLNTLGVLLVTAMVLGRI